MGQKIKNILDMILSGVLEIIYPKTPYCIICKEAAEGICDKCLKKITYCKEEELTIGYYKGVLKQLILRLKYKQDFVAGEILVDLIVTKIDKCEKDYVLTYIPMTASKKRKRGFNQCEYIAQELSKRTNIKVLHLLKKVRETYNQKTLIKEERSRNIVGAFQVKNKKDVNNKKIILIDDVITTGATINEAVKVLKKNGAKEIKILTLAKSHI